MEQRLGSLGLHAEEADELHRRLERHHRLIDRLGDARAARPHTEASPARTDPAGEPEPPRGRGRRARARVCPIDGRPWPHDRPAWQVHHKQIKRRHGGINCWRQRTPEAQRAWIKMMNQARRKKRATRRLDALPRGQREQLVRTLGQEGALAWVWAHGTTA